MNATRPVTRTIPLSRCFVSPEVEEAALRALRSGQYILGPECRALDARYKGTPVGSFAHVGAFSFYPSKNLTVLGDGGCLTTNDEALADKLRMLRNHGRKGKYRHEFAGFNVRFNEI